jgi:diguanylate cyclase (GGDEF)-like protein
MRLKGRMTTILLVFFIHTGFIAYYFIRDNAVEIVDIISIPFLLTIAYWVGFQYDKIKHLSEKDVLTNLYNRRYIIENFDRMSKKAHCMKRKLFALVIDCDNFKEINDKLGHAKGDEVLRMLGKILIEKTRQYDVVCRWGGDEFLIVGEYKDQESMDVLIDRLSTEARKYAIQDNLFLSISIGAAVYPDGDITLQELMRIADERMYGNKFYKKPKEQAV